VVKRDPRELLVLRKEVDKEGTQDLSTIGKSGVAQGEQESGLYSTCFMSYALWRLQEEHSGDTQLLNLTEKECPVCYQLRYILTQQIE
jgi:hypothetical protein